MEGKMKKIIKKIVFKMKIIKKIFKEPRFLLVILIDKGIFDWIHDDTCFLRIFYWARTGKHLNLDNPVLLNEKLQWLKLHDRNPQYTMMVDKCRAKKYVANIIGEEYIIPTLGVWNHSSEINFDELPDKFVLKCNHNSGKGMCRCTDKSSINIKKIRKKLDRALKKNYYKAAREWPYKNVERKIIGEKYIENSDGSPLVDYKFYCYGGKPRYFMYSLGEADHNVRNHKFDMNLQSIDHLFKKIPAIPVDEIRLPDNIDKMIELVEKLCQGFQHIRIDLYNVDGKIYFGEMTFFAGSGIINIDSEKYSQELANYINIKAVMP